MKSKLITAFLTISLAASGFTGVLAKDNTKVKTASPKIQVIEKLQKVSGGTARISLRGDNELQVFVYGKLSEKREISERSAEGFLEENKALFGLNAPEQSFKAYKLEKDNLGYTHVRLKQLIKGMPVEGREVVVSFNKDGVVGNISGTVERDAQDITYLGSGRVTESAALTAAKAQFNYTALKNEPTVQKVVLVKDGAAYETYKINVQYTEPEIGNFDVYVEVSSGKIVDKVSRILYDGPVTGTGTAVDGTTKPLNLYLSGSSYQMTDTTKAMTGQIKTYTANNAQVEPGTLVASSTNSFTTTTFKAPVSAHYYAGVVYDFYKNLFGRNSINGSGMSIISTTHYGSAYNNAFWDGSQMVYGDGDGSEFTYFSGDLDVVAHELTHGVTTYSANLDYSYQQGALNESISDIFGVLAETYDKYNVKNGGSWTFNSSDWVVGDQIYTPGVSGDALRSLANPTLYGQPDNMSGYVNTSSDNGGVHTNSGIPNKAAYLIAQSVGNLKTANIFYRALTVYLTSSSDFLAARNACVQAATDLYGSSSAEVNAVNTAFTTVGIGSSSGSDPYEPNDSLSQAYPISSGVTYSAYIYSPTDYDVYKLSGRSGYTISASLTNLPKDYDLFLIDRNGYLVAYSENGSTYSESISYRATYSGVYYLDVEGYNGAYSTTTKYNLRATF